MKKLFLTLSVLLLAVSDLSAIYVKQQGQSVAFGACAIAGELGAQYRGGVVINGTFISSFILKGAVSGGAIGGTAGGYAGGFTSGLIMTGDIKEANKAGLNGLYSGAAIGGITGSMSGYKYAKDNGLNLWTGKKVVNTKAFHHDYEYADRVRIRAEQDPTSHNFPYSFDDAVLSTEPILKNNGYRIFQQQGTMNGKNGIFEIGVTNNNIIDHRFFRPIK
jgi:hypothetical protein